MVLKFFRFILNKITFTAAGPGCMCICGIKYDLSLDFYRDEPKVSPFGLIN